MTKMLVYENAQVTIMLRLQQCSSYNNAQVTRMHPLLALLVITLINDRAENTVVSLSTFPTSPAHSASE